MSDKTLMIIDCDAGIDDAQAIMMALSQPNVEILAITCVAGNVSVNQVVLNVLRILKVCGKLGQVPVYKGAESAILTREEMRSTHFHGMDGLGDVADDNASDESHVSPGNAVLKMVELVQKYPNKITIAALGPLTNLALAARLDPEFANNVKDISIMGGNIEGRGNVRVCAEFNFYIDSEAAHVVLNDFTCPVYVLSWETTCNYPLDWEWFKKWMETPTEKGVFMKKICQFGMKYYETERAQNEVDCTNGWVACDPVAMAVAIDKQVVTKMKQHYATVELTGEYSRGMMVVDWCDLLKKTKTVNIVTDIDVKLLQKMMELSLQ
ncbi:inosine-uridine preferring nucleoside hydrolase-like [Glandiceps talaboti]